MASHWFRTNMNHRRLAKTNDSTSLAGEVISADRGLVSHGSVWLGAALAIACCALVWATAGLAQGGGLPDPCMAIPSADVMAALGLKRAPVANLASVPNIETCSVGNGDLSVSVGFTTIANPAMPLKVVSLSLVPNGTYRTYANSTQTEVLFFKGTAAAGTYGVVRNYVKIKKKYLVAIAEALYAAIGQGPGTQTTPSVQLVGGNG